MDERKGRSGGGMKYIIAAGLEAVFPGENELS